MGSKSQPGPGDSTRSGRVCVRFVATAAASAARVHAPGRGARGGLLGGAGLRERSPWSASRAPPEELNRAGNSAANSACNSDFGSTLYRGPTELEPEGVSVKGQ